jgi:hypothetical protein
MSAPLLLAPCEGMAHVGETTLTRAELDELKQILESDDVEKKDILRIIKTLKITLNNVYDLNLIEEAESVLTGKGTRRNTVGRAIQYLLTLIDRVFPKSNTGASVRRSRKHLTRRRPRKFRN